jgi:hypothetical protein
VRVLCLMNDMIMYNHRFFLDGSNRFLAFSLLRFGPNCGPAGSRWLRIVPVAGSYWRASSRFVSISSALLCHFALAAVRAGSGAAWLLGGPAPRTTGPRCRCGLVHVNSVWAFLWIVRRNAGWTGPGRGAMAGDDRVCYAYAFQRICMYLAIYRDQSEACAFQFYYASINCCFLSDSNFTF